jgi:hypothetical protein
MLTMVDDEAGVDVSPVEEPDEVGALLDIVHARLDAAELLELMESLSISVLPAAPVAPDADGLYRYALIGEGVVDRDLVKVARKAAAWCAADLNLPEIPEVGWFRPEGAEHRKYLEAWGSRSWAVCTSEIAVRGLHSAGRIWLLATLDDHAEVAEVVAHECRHAQQHARGALGPAAGRDLIELDARRYAARTRKDIHRDLGV